MSRPRVVRDLVLAATLFCGAHLPAHDQWFVEEFRRGDVNEDGLVDVTDAVMILKVLFVGDTDLWCEDKADTDDSGVLDVTDSLYLLSFVYLGGDPIPEPYTLYGRDPSEDDLVSCGFWTPHGLGDSPGNLWIDFRDLNPPGAVEGWRA